MRVENLHEGQIIKNYKELCDILEIKAKPSSNTNGRKAQHKEFDRYFSCNKQGHKYIITKIYENPKEKVDKRNKNSGGNNLKYKDILSPKELSNEFDGFYVYRHILNDEIIYVGKGCKRRVVNGNRSYDVKTVQKEIVKRFDDEFEALKFEEGLIKYYKSIGQCKYNSDIYVPGVTHANKNRKLKPKKPKDKEKEACELLLELGYQFDKYKGWYIN